MTNKQQKILNYMLENEYINNKMYEELQILLKENTDGFLLASKIFDHLHRNFFYDNKDKSLRKLLDYASHC